MATLEYSDLNGYGMVHAPMISIYLFNALGDTPINPICMVSPFGTFHFGTNIALFGME